VAKGVDQQLDLIMRRLDELEAIVAKVSRILAIELTKVEGS